jgi:hypothetical protein
MRSCPVHAAVTTARDAVSLGMMPPIDDFEPITALFVTIAPHPTFLTVVEMAVSERDVKRIALAPAWEDQEAWAKLLQAPCKLVRSGQRP